MKKLLSFSVLVTVLFVLSVEARAVVPQMMNYQGKLTTAAGGCLSDTVQMTFSIYPDTMLGTLAEWSETQTEVVVKEGVFSVLLGSVDSIPASVFDGGTKYLGVQVESDPEMTPLKPMVSVAYAYRAGTVDGGGGGGGWVDDGTVVRLEDSTDYVGIGTTSPAHKLDVFGQNVIANFGDDPVALRLGGDADAYIGAYATGGGKPTIYLGSNSYYTTSGWLQPNPTRNSALLILQDGNFAFRNGGPGNPLGSEKMIMDSSGNVGIGATSPTSRLELVGDATIKAEINEGFALLGFDSKNNLGQPVNTGQIFGVCSQGASDARLGFNIINSNGTGWTEALTLKNGGNVGIGTTSPSSKLDVTNRVSLSSDAWEGLRIFPDGYLSVNWETGVGPRYVSKGKHMFFLDSNNDEPGQDFIIYDGGGTSTTATELFRVTETGKVGIGTTSPRSKLDVNGVASCQTYLRIYGDLVNYHELRHNSISGALEIDPIGSNMLVIPDGNVGIGTTSPDARVAATTGDDEAGSFRNNSSLRVALWAYNTSGTGLSCGTGSSSSEAFRANSYLSGEGDPAIQCYGRITATGRIKGHSTVNGVNAVEGISQGDFAGVAGKNEGASGGAGIYGYSVSGGVGVRGEEPQGGAGFAMYADGDMHVAGTFTAVSKLSVVNTSQGKTGVYCQESPEIWFEDFGEGQLKNGHAHIDLDGLFLETVTISQKHPMKVFVQLNDDCGGVYVKRGNTGFDVYELNEGKSNAHFTYRIVAKRKGYEDKRLERVEERLSSK